jgi:hypothetical protein
MQEKLLKGAEMPEKELARLLKDRKKLALAAET